MSNRKRIEGFVFFPDKFISQTIDFSGYEIGIYIKMLCRIWSLTSTQYSFEDTLDNWSIYTGLRVSERLRKVRKKFLDKREPLFKIRRKKGSINKLFILQNGLCKSLNRARRVSKQNSKNAHGGKNQELKQKTRARTTASETHSEKHASRARKISSDQKLSSSFLNISKEPIKDKDEEKRNGKISKKIESAENTLVGKEILSKWLSNEQINRVKEICNLSEEYIEVKVKIMEKQKPQNRAAFLYAALTQDYRGEDVREGEHLIKNKRNRGGEDEWIRRGRKGPVSEVEFKEVPEELRSRFRKEEHVIADHDVYVLKSKPKICGDSRSRIIFQSMEIGETMEVKGWEGLPKENRSHFTKKHIGLKTGKRYHLVK